MINQFLDEIINDFREYLTHHEDPFAIRRQTSIFESELADAFGTKECVLLSSGTAAIHSALFALGIGRGDKVLVPALSVVMSVSPILYQGTEPVIVDSEPSSVDFDYADLERKISPAVKAVMPVYLWGCSYDVSRLTSFAQKHRIAVIEDACQAFGSRWRGKYLGTWGTIGCFSMESSKLLSTGEGGFILTEDTTLAQKARYFRSHYINTQNPKLSHSHIGWNYRLSELQAIYGRWQLKNMNKILNHRQWQTQYILKKAQNLPQLEIYEYMEEEEPNYFSPVLLLREKFATRRIAEELDRQGVVNSVGTFGLRPVQEWGFLKEKKTIGLLKTLNAKHFLERVIAPVLLPWWTKEELDHISIMLEKVLFDDHLS